MATLINLDALQSLKGWCEAHELNYSATRRAARKGTLPEGAAIKVGGRWLTDGQADVEAVKAALATRATTRTYEHKRWFVHASSEDIEALRKYAEDEGLEVEIVDPSKRRKRRKAAKAALIEAGEEPEDGETYVQAAKRLELV